MSTIPRYPRGALVKLRDKGAETGTVQNIVADEPPRYWIQWDDGTHSCHSQREIKRVGQLYGKLE